MVGAPGAGDWSEEDDGAGAGGGRPALPEAAHESVREGANEADVLSERPLRRGRLAPAELYPAGDARVAARFVRLPGGERVRVVTAGDPSAPAVVLVHGWACSAYSWRHQLPALAAAGFHSVAFDLRGHGLSDRPASPGLYSGQAMADFLERLLDVLELDRVALVGHSLGAAIAARVAMRRPARVDRLAVISGVGFGRAPLIRVLSRLPDGLVAPLLPLAAPRPLFRLVLRFVAGGPGRYTARDVDEYWAPTQFPRFLPVLWRLIRQHGWAPFHADELARLRMPLLALFGGRDRLVHQAAPPPRGRLSSGSSETETHILTGVGHAGHEEAPALVNALLLPFLEPWRQEHAAAPGLTASAG